HLSTTIASAVEVVSEKPFYFGCVAAAAGVVVWQIWCPGWAPVTRLLAFNGGLCVVLQILFFCAFLISFPWRAYAYAETFFCYNTHLPLVLVLPLALAVLAFAVTASPRTERVRVASGFVVLIALLAPFAFVKRLRFDLDMPQPLVWDLAKNLSQHLRN